MQPFHAHKEFFNSPVLTGDQDPYEIIKDYFDDREMYEVRIKLWNLVETALCSPNIQFHESAERQQINLLLWTTGRIDRGCLENFNTDQKRN